MTATVALPANHHSVAQLAVQNAIEGKSFNPSILETMENGTILDMIDMSTKIQGVFSDSIAYAVTVLIERGAYDLVKARFGGSDGADEPSFLVTREARKLLAPRIIKKGWTQQQVADLFGVSQGSIAGDIKAIIKSDNRSDEIPSERVNAKGEKRPTTYKPRAKKVEDEEPVDAEIVEDPDANKKFRCSSCGKQKPFGTRQELDDGKLYCEPCADDYDNSKPEPAEPTTRLVKSTTKTRKLADLQREVWNTAASMPWTQQQLQFINDTLDKINELMEEEL